MQLKSVILLLLNLPAAFIFSQQRNLPLNREWGLESDKTTSTVFSKTDLTHEIVYNNQSCFKPNLYSSDAFKKNTTISLFIRKLKKESLFIINDTADKFHLTIDPLFNFEYGKDFDDSSKSFYKNTRGVLVRGDIGTKFSFESSFYENQATFVNYIRNYNNTSLIVPGQGRWKQFKNNGYDFAMASGYVSYSPNDHFNFQIGT